MPKEYFKVSNTTSIRSIPPGGRIHITGVCGVAMAQLAVLLAEQGYQVSGSDKEYYEPMASLLRNSAVKTLTGYKTENVPANVDLVVIGNSISYGNPEVDAVEQRNLAYTSFPQILDEVVISDKHSITISGTHGKSTTSALIASMLHKMGLDPSYFIGGVALDLPSSLHAGGGDFCVLEGDEYDSAFFAKVPKFAFYHPDTCVVNAVEFDHADIYADLAAINKEFTKLINDMRPDATAICCIDFPNLKELVDGWRKSAVCKLVTFGEDPSSDVVLSSRVQEGFHQKISAQSKKLGDFNFEIPIPGAYNAKNALAALIVAKVIGIDTNKASRALATFQSVKRRQEVRYSDDEIVLIEDFAHHPTAVYETLKAVREAFPKKNIWAVFEPRSNTSRRKVFQSEYVRAFASANCAILADVETRGVDSGQELLDVNVLSQNINDSGVTAVCLANAKAIEDYVMQHLRPNDVIVVMSNGSFGGLIQNLETRLKKR